MKYNVCCYVQACRVQCMRRSSRVKTLNSLLHLLSTSKIKNSSYKSTVCRRYAYIELTMEIAYHKPELQLYEDASDYPWRSNPTQQALLETVEVSGVEHTASRAKTSAPCTEVAQANDNLAADSTLYSRSKVHIRCSLFASTSCQTPCHPSS